MKKTILLLLIFQILVFQSSSLEAGKKSKKNRILSSSLKFSNLNSGEALCPNGAYEIRWDGVEPEDEVKIEYSTNGGSNWITITESATGLKYNWIVPNTPSANCIARVVFEVPEYVTICGRVWMNKNLDVDKYRNGDNIRYCSTTAQWNNANDNEQGAYCYYNFDETNNEIYGKLYNGFAVLDSRGLAPSGWHVPTDDEFTTLEECLGGASVAGGKLKSVGTKEETTGLWYSPNSGAEDTYDFHGIPSGGRDISNGFLNIGYQSTYWSSSNFWLIYTYMYARFLYYNSTRFRPESYMDYSFELKLGFSVRCVQDI